MSDQRISIANGKLSVPNQPVIPFIEGDGTGPDIWAASVKVFDAALEKAYGGELLDEDGAPCVPTKARPVIERIVADMNAARLEPGGAECQRLFSFD